MYEMTDPVPDSSSQNQRYTRFCLPNSAIFPSRCPEVLEISAVVMKYLQYTWVVKVIAPQNTPQQSLDLETMTRSLKTINPCIFHSSPFMDDTLANITPLLRRKTIMFTSCPVISILSMSFPHGAVIQRSLVKRLAHRKVCGLP